MFTGIINHIGRFKGFRLGKKELAVETISLASKLEIGDSLAVNGVCLSVIKKEKNTLFFNLSEETLKKTNLSSLHSGEMLNIELPLTLDSLLSGHLVTGHIDSTEKVLKISRKKDGKTLTISLPSELSQYFIYKGSIALNGVSLTISEITASSFCVDLIPITIKNSNLGTLKKGDKVNIECDIIGKYMYNFINKIKKNSQG